MPDFDWTHFGQINGWQTIATIAVIVIALFLIARFLMRFWPWLKKVIALGDALAQLPAFIDRTDVAIADIHHEVKYNNGSSVKDAIRRVETGVASLHKKVDEQKATLEAADEEIRHNLERTKPPARKRATPKPKETP